MKIIKPNTFIIVRGCDYKSIATFILKTVLNLFFFLSQKMHGQKR